ncbi:uncharacterized protein LOC105735899 [Apis florea]|uniref:uncharacterized protein LOC105735899 n=1 Tax=Apis florea TaxID=7463 RepID=UPI0012FF481F|nr:uncharacterized protein LOC105735899 [Apis florea]
MNARHERAKGWATSKFCEEVKKSGRRRARRRRLANSDGIERIASRFEQEFVDKVMIFRDSKLIIYTVFFIGSTSMHLPAKLNAQFIPSLTLARERVYEKEEALGQGGDTNSLDVLRRSPQFADPVRKEQKSMSIRGGRERAVAKIDQPVDHCYVYPKLASR